MIYLQTGGMVREFNLLSHFCYENKIEVELETLKAIQQNRVVLKQGWIASGTVEFVHAFLKALGKQIPNPDTYPEVLREFLKREIRKTTIEKLPEDYTGFIKPVELKKFTGFVMRDGDTYNIKHCSKKTEVYLSEEVKFVSEWRYYVLNGQIVACGHYGGDESVKCDLRIPIKAASRIEGTYLLDFGVLKNGETVLVEFNDAYSFGWYLDDDVDILYEMVNTRMLEIIGG